MMPTGCLFQWLHFSPACWNPFLIEIEYLLSFFFLWPTLPREALLLWTPKLQSLSFAWLPLKVMADISNPKEIRALPLYQVFWERIRKVQTPNGEYSCWNTQALNPTLRNLEKIGLLLPPDRWVRCGISLASFLSFKCFESKSV